MFYISQYPVHWTARSTLHFACPGRPDHSDDTNSASLVRISHSAITARRLFTHISTAVDTAANGILTRTISIARPAFYRSAIAVHMSVIIDRTIQLSAKNLTHGQYWTGSKQTMLLQQGQWGYIASRLYILQLW